MTRFHRYWEIGILQDLDYELINSFIRFGPCSRDTCPNRDSFYHYDDVIMGAMASQITSLTIVYSKVYSDADKKTTSKLRVNGLCAGNSPGTGEFPAQMASNAENVSIWWRHHVVSTLLELTVSMLPVHMQPHWFIIISATCFRTNDFLVQNIRQWSAWREQ